MEKIQEVIDRLDDMIADARAQQSRIGWFATMYRRVTLEVQAGIESGVFQDPARMELFDVRFAEMFFRAWDVWSEKKPVFAAWARAFEALHCDDIAVPQHLLLGMNAHINLDLGIAAYNTMQEWGQPLAEIEADYFHINQILASMVESTVLRLTTIWPPLARIDRLLGDHDARWVGFSLSKARDFAWCFAQELEQSSHDDHPRQIDCKDLWVSSFAQGIRRPGLWTRFLLWTIRRAERGSISDKIDRLF